VDSKIDMLQRGKLIEIVNLMLVVGISENVVGGAHNKSLYEFNDAFRP